MGAWLGGGAGWARGAITFADAVAFASAVAFTRAGGWRGVVVAGASWGVVLREGRGGETGDSEEQEQTEGCGFHGSGRASCVRPDWPRLRADAPAPDSADLVRRDTEAWRLAGGHMRASRLHFSAALLILYLEMQENC